MPTIRWSNGVEDKAATWQELLDRVRTTQWNAINEIEFRGVLATRAYRWSLTKIDAYAEPGDLFRALAKAHLIEITNEEEN